MRRSASRRWLADAARKVALGYSPRSSARSASRSAPRLTAQTPLRGPGDQRRSSDRRHHGMNDLHSLPSLSIDRWCHAESGIGPFVDPAGRSESRFKQGGIHSAPGAQLLLEPAEPRRLRIPARCHSESLPEEPAQLGGPGPHRPGQPAQCRRERRLTRAGGRPARAGPSHAPSRRRTSPAGSACRAGIPRPAPPRPGRRRPRSVGPAAARDSSAGRRSRWYGPRRGNGRPHAGRAPVPPARRVVLRCRDRCRKSWAPRSPPRSPAGGGDAIRF